MLTDEVVFGGTQQLPPISTNVDLPFLSNEILVM